MGDRGHVRWETIPCFAATVKIVSVDRTAPSRVYFAPGTALASGRAGVTANATAGQGTQAKPARRFSPRVRTWAIAQATGGALTARASATLASPASPATWRVIQVVWDATPPSMGGVCLGATGMPPVNANPNGRVSDVKRRQPRASWTRTSRAGTRLEQSSCLLLP